jgi:hypothetical protein
MQKNTLHANIVSALLSKLDSSIFLLDKNGKRASILNYELAEQPLNSWAFWRAAPVRTNIFDSLIPRQEFSLMGKIISLLSPALAMRELQKARTGNRSLMEMFIDQIAHTQEPIKHVIEKMRAIPERFFEGLMSGFRADILGLIKAKSESLAKELYHLAPGFMQRQFPDSVSALIESEQVNFPADLPPAYKPNA